MSDELPGEDLEARYAAAMAKGRRSRSADSQVQHFEEAARLADQRNDLDGGWDARWELIEAGTNGGHFDRALVAFAWCRARATKHPERFDREDLLWRHKWMLETLALFPGMSRKQLDAALEDFAQSARAQGAGLRSELKLRCTVALHTGELAEARRLFPLWVDAPRDWNSDCAACDLDLEICAASDAGEHERALELAAPILAGRSSCLDVPLHTNGWIALSYFQLGRLTEARDVFLRGYRPVTRNRKMLPVVGRFITLLGLTGNEASALTLVERHLAWALEAKASLVALDFHAAARFVFERLVLAHPEELPLRLPRAFALHRRSGHYPPALLRDWFDGEARRLATSFDQRNGNGERTAWLERTRDWHEQVRPIEITTGLG